MSNFSMLRHLAVAGALCAVPFGAQAQRAMGVANCAWKPSDAWVKRQAEFFDESKRDWTNDTLRTALLAAAGLTAPLKAPVQLGVEIEGRPPKLGPTADAMRAQLRVLSTKRAEWPTRAAIGGAGVHAIYLLSLADTALGRAALHMMMEAGPTESPAADVATFEDHMRLAWGRKQIYGTQFTTGANGAIVLAPMEDSTHADLRREDAGLPPFKLGLCFARQAK